MRALVFCFAPLSIAIAIASCGSKPKPVAAPVAEDAAAPIPDAAPLEAPDAAPEAAPPPPKTYALCSVGGDPTSTHQCLVWTGCANGMVLAINGKPFRNCTAPQSDCEETEEKLTMASQRIEQGTRPCKNKFFLTKELKIGDATWRVCPEDAEDKELSTLWKRVVPSCRLPMP